MDPAVEGLAAIVDAASACCFDAAVALALAELAALSVIATGEEFDVLSLHVASLVFATVAYGFGLVTMGAWWGRSPP
jgi:hypothetical protein